MQLFVLSSICVKNLKKDRMVFTVIRSDRRSKYKIHDIPYKLYKIHQKTAETKIAKQLCMGVPY